MTESQMAVDNCLNKDAPGMTLLKWCQQFPGGKVPLVQALEIVRQLATALDYAHGQDVSHRDVMPANVIVETKADRQIVARILDFGHAAELRSPKDSASREPYDTSEKRPYMAPELWIGDRQGPAAEQYALAVLFYELVTGDVPFAGVFETGDPVIMFTAVTMHPPAIPDDLPNPVRKALAKALAKKPGERFATCSAFVGALAAPQEVPAQVETTHVPQKGTSGEAVLNKKKVGALWKVILAGMLAIVGILTCCVSCVCCFPPGGRYRNEAKSLPGGVTNTVTIAKGDKSSLPVHFPSGETNGATMTIMLPGGAEMVMVYVEPGSFMMGSENGSDLEKPVHKVTLTRGFWLGKYEVTQAQWEIVMGHNQSRFKGDDMPVDCVSWDDTQAFIRKVNAKLGTGAVRLPTEAEWEYACRAGTTGDYGGTGNIDDMGWYGSRFGGKNEETTHPVGKKGANAWGFHDMHGNVFEWCDDWFGDYSRGRVVNPTRSDPGRCRVLRGGCWSSGAKGCRSASRMAMDVSYRAHGYYGFRLCCSAGPSD